MKKNHKVQITFDEATGELTVRHYTNAKFGGQTIVSHQDVTSDPESEAGLKAYLTGVIDANRETMEQTAEMAAVNHVAALAGTFKGKQLTFTGGISVSGSFATKPQDKPDAPPSA